MKTILRLIILLGIGLFVITGCKPKKAVTVEKPAQMEAKNSTLETILPAPINSADQKELGSTVYKDPAYMVLQNEADRFKDNASFIEYLEGGKKERLWFSSSRADTIFFGAKKTNRYQQIYYSDRVVNQGQWPSEGWSQPKLLTATTDNPFMNDLVKAFNQATKGAVTMAGNIIILSCDQISKTGNSEYKDLWEISQTDAGFNNPKPLATLSNPDTWESQPALSPNGKHLFFVSDRKVNATDFTFSNDKTANQITIFYSFRENGQWRAPVVVKEIYSKFNQVTPHVLYDSQKLLFSSDKTGNYEIYEVKIALDDQAGGYTIDPEGVTLLHYAAINTSIKTPKAIVINDKYNQQYPFIYHNLLNHKAPRAIFWSSDDPAGFGSYDLYGCALPFKVQLKVSLADKYENRITEAIPGATLRLDGFQSDERQEQNTTFSLFSHVPYTISGGSIARDYDCRLDPSFIQIGYSEIGNYFPDDKEMHKTVMTGPTAKSEFTQKFGHLPLDNIHSDTTITDIVFITRAWERKEPCPGKLNIAPKYSSIPYFQTGFWEVNTSENLKRDLALLHKGFQVDDDNNYMDPTDYIKRLRSDYSSEYGVNFPILKDDGYTYSIANAKWIELHPNNSYWGVTPEASSHLKERLQGRKDRINQYVEYAKKVDENLKNLTDTVKLQYIDLLDKHREKKPQLLIEIFAVSDQREVVNSWYIGEPVQYHSTEYDENKKEYVTSLVKIVAPEVNEAAKKIPFIKPCTIEMKDGDNGSKLGFTNNSSNSKNTNLSRLRAWYGYKEVYKLLMESKEFQRFVKEGKVALPDNDVSTKDADIVIITRGILDDGKLEEKKLPYPAVNNPQGNGYFDFDKIRRIEIHTRLIISKDKQVEQGYCCDPTEKK